METPERVRMARLVRALSNSGRALILWFLANLWYAESSSAALGISFSPFSVRKICRLITLILSGFGCGKLAAAKIIFSAKLVLCIRNGLLKL